MDRFCKVLFVSACVLFGGNAVAQATPAARINTIQLKNAAPAAQVAPSSNSAAISRVAPGIAIPVDAEAQVQAEIKRQQKKRDDISNALARVGANFSKLTYTPATGNSCIDPDTTWNPRSGESFSCVGMTTCIGRMSRWSKNRSNPCEPGVTIDSCVISDECKAGSVCDTGAKKCVRAR
jgi:hypothetical protein